MYESVTVIVTFPEETPVTIPLLFTVAIDSSLDVYVKVSIEASDGVAFNFNCKSLPTLTVLLVDVKERVFIGVITFISFVCSIPSYITFIVALPSDTATISLFSFILAIFSSELSTVNPSFASAPSIIAVILDVSSSTDDNTSFSNSN